MAMTPPENVRIIQTATGVPPRTAPSRAQSKISTPTTRLEEAMAIAPRMIAANENNTPPAGLFRLGDFTADTAYEVQWSWCKSNDDQDLTAVTCSEWDHEHQYKSFRTPE